MRILPLLALILALSMGGARAQVQEKKLIDRLLQPNMALRNSAQDKKFAPQGTGPAKQARTSTFYVKARSGEKQFGGIRNFFTKIFGTRRSRYSDLQAGTKTRNRVSTRQITATASNYASTKPTLAMNQPYETSEFADNDRSFLVRGKSQKALSAQDRPLTIEQVRELLNKNK